MSSFALHFCMMHNYPRMTGMCYLLVFIPTQVTMPEIHPHLFHETHTLMFPSPTS